MIFGSRVLSLILFSLFVSIVMALIRRQSPADRLKFGLILFLIMAGGALALAWLIAAVH